MIGATMFPRAPRGVEPSDIARLLARYAELVFAEVRQGFEEVGELAGRTDSRIAIGSLPLARSEFLPAAVTRLLRLFEQPLAVVVRPGHPLLGKSPPPHGRNRDYHAR